MDDQFCAAHEIEKFAGDFYKAGFVLQEFQTDAVYGLRAFVDVAFGIEVVVKMSIGQLAVIDFDAADFDDSVPQLVLKAGRFGIENDLSHDVFR